MVSYGFLGVTTSFWSNRAAFFSTKTPLRRDRGTTSQELHIFHMFQLLHREHLTGSSWQIIPRFSDNWLVVVYLPL